MRKHDVEARYRSLVDNSGGGLTITEIQGDGTPVNTFISDGMLRLLHSTRTQWDTHHSNNIYEKVHPDDVDAARDFFERLCENGGNDTASYRLLCDDGAVTWTNASGSCIVENGKTQIYTIHTDVTKQYAMLDQITFLNHTAVDLFSGTDADSAFDIGLTDILEFFDGQRAYIFEFDTDNKTACNTYEVCAPDAEPAKDLLQEVPYAAFSKWFSLFDRDGYIAISDVSTLEEGRETERELLELQNISSLIVVPMKEDGDIIGMMGVDDPARNVDQMPRLQAIGNYVSILLSRRDMTHKLRDRNLRMQAMMNDTPGGFAQMLIHADNSVLPIFFNDGFCRMIGMTRSETHEIYDMDAYAGLYPADRARISALLSDAIENRTALTTRMHMQTGDGGGVPVEAHYHVWENPDGELFINGYYHDISETLAQEEEYRRNIAYRNINSKGTIGSFHLNVTKISLMMLYRMILTFCRLSKPVRWMIFWIAVLQTIALKNMMSLYLCFPAVLFLKLLPTERVRWLLNTPCSCLMTERYGFVQLSISLKTRRPAI